LTEWWREFFDEEYLFLYQAELDPGRTEGEVAGVVDLLELREGARIVDLCCGDGRHSVPLHRRGYAVVGVDRSETLLRHARKRAARVLPDGDAGPPFVRADARALPLLRRFDAVVLLFNSIGYGSDAETLAMLAESRAALRPGGQILVDCVHRDGLVLQMGGLTQHAVFDVNGTQVEIDSQIAPVEGVLRALFRWSRGGQVLTRELRHRLYTATELALLLGRAGFRRMEFRGEYDGRPFAAEKPLLLAHAWA
jgi:SAM-dependent methyltransferase